MLSFFKWFFGLFSPYVNPFERKVDKFFRNIKSTSSFADVKGELLSLMQQDLIVTNVWLEKKYKGYKYLDKKTRRKMYADVQEMVKKFQEHCVSNNFDETQIRAEVQNVGAIFPDGDNDKMAYLSQIKSFLEPEKYYHYIKTASFGKLLRDPNKEKLEGDCNQIVTLYIYLFSLKFPIENLNIKLLPEHVCLHFRSIDVECTNATFAKYPEEDQILPVTEIISTNLLDLADFREEVQTISQREMVKSAQLAYSISSLKSLVEKNLNIAYKNLAISSLKISDFATAVFYFTQANDREGLKNTYHNAAVYYLKQNNFSKAYYYANQSSESDLAKTVKRNEAVYNYNSGSLERAMTLFRELSDNEMLKACYAKQYNEVQKQVANVRTVEQAKSKKSVYQKMLELAQKMGDSPLENSVRDTLNKL